MTQTPENSQAGARQSWKVVHETAYALRLRSVTILVLFLAVIPFAKGQSRYSITGRLTSDTEGIPISKAKLTAQPGEENDCTPGSPSFSDVQGHFLLELPCGGLWYLKAEAPGYPAQTYEEHGSLSTGIVLTQPRATIDLAFRIVPNASLTGILLDEAGEAVAEAQVTLLDVSADEPHSIGTQTTDDRGIYEFPNLVPGSYQVAAQTQPWYAFATRSISSSVASPGAADSAASDPSLDMTYPITYYPGVTDPDSATTLQLSAGTTQQADFHLSPVPSIHITLPGNGTEPEPGRRALGTVFSRRNSIAPPIREVSPLGATFFQPTSSTLNEDSSIDVGGFAPGTYTLSKADTDRSRSIAGQQTFTLQRDPGHAVAINPALVAPQVKASEAGNFLRGTASENAKPTPGALLLLVAIEKPSLTSSRIRRQQSSTDGSFRFSHLPAGNYILVAIVDGWRLNLNDAATLSRYLQHGQPIHLTGSTTLTQPVEAVP